MNKNIRMKKEKERTIRQNTHKHINLLTILLNNSLDGNLSGSVKLGDTHHHAIQHWARVGEEALVCGQDVLGVVLRHSLPHRKHPVPCHDGDLLLNCHLPHSMGRSW